MNRPDSSRLAAGQVVAGYVVGSLVAAAHTYDLGTPGRQSADKS